MKFRPQMQLRFRGESQFKMVKEIASKQAPSVNEWILMQIEKANPTLAIEDTPESKKVKPRAKAKPDMETETQSTRPGCKECGAVGGLHQRGCPEAKKG